MVDPFGRAVTNLRISVTDCFDFYSTYRMAENMSVPPKKNLLSLQKLHLQCSAFLAKTRAQAGTGILAERDTYQRSMTVPLATTTGPARCEVTLDICNPLQGPIRPIHVVSPPTNFTIDHT